MYLGKQKIWINTFLWRRLPQRVREVGLAFTLCAESEDGILHCRQEDLRWAAKSEELKRVLSWLLRTGLAHYCNCRYYLNPTLARENLGEDEKSFFEKWAALTSIPF